MIEIDAEEIYSFSPAGGVLILTADSPQGDKILDGPFYERLIFLVPKARFTDSAVAINTDSEEYSPGDLVDVSINIDTAALSAFDDDEDLFAAVTVTDVSALLKVPDHRHGPTLPTMLYLEKEVQLAQTEDFLLIKELEYSGEFIDAAFTVDQPQDSATFENLDLLLGNQAWRKHIYSGKNPRASYEV